MGVARDSSSVDVRLSAESRLDSRKEIAAYLKRSVRTVRRWETEEHLPVHRHVHRNAGSVYAFRGELDAWLAGRSLRLPVSTQEEPRALDATDATGRHASPHFRVSRGTAVVGALALMAVACAGLWEFRSVLRDSSPAIAGAATVPLANLTSDSSRKYPDGRREPRSVDADAHQLFLKSLIAASARTYDGYQDAIAYCRQAIEKDPAFAAAYARMSLFYLQFSFFGTIAPKAFMPQAEAAARRAIDLDDTLAESHAVLGAVLYRFRWEWPQSEREFRRALVLNPSYAEGHRMLSAFLTAVGRSDEAVAEAQRALELDPRWVQARINLGMALRAAGKYDAAIEEFRSTLQKNPNQALAHFQLGNAYVSKGMLRAGAGEFERAVALSEGNPIFLSSLAYAYAHSGRTDKTRKILSDLEARAGRQYVPPTAIARLYVALDDRQSAHAWIEKAYLERDLDLISTNADIGLSGLRSDPGFRDIFSRVGLDR